MSTKNSTVNVIWMANGRPTGDPMHGQKVIGSSGANGWCIYTDDNTGGWNPNEAIWIGEPYSPHNPNPWDNNSPWYAPAPTSPPPITLPSFPPAETDEDGNKVVTAPAPSLELIMVEIARVLRDGGDILEIREIFERYKLKLVDHDGEVIFDPKKAEELEDRGF